MTCSAVGREPKGHVIGIRRLFIVGSVTSRTSRGCAFKPRGMTADTVDRDVGTSQREVSGGMVKQIVGITGRMTGQAGRIAEDVAVDSRMLLICFGIGMARRTTDDRIVARRGMTLSTLVPGAGMCAAVDREELCVMIKCRWCPGALVVTTGAVRRKLRLHVVRIDGVVVLFCMAPEAGVGCVEIITIVTGSTIIGDQGVCLNQRVVIVMIRECRRIPVGVRCMTRGTIHRQVQRLMIRIDRALVIWCVTIGAQGRSACVTFGMATDTIDADMGPGERKIGVSVVKDAVGITGRMAGETGCILIDVPLYSIVLLIGIRIGVAYDTAEDCEIIGCGMTLRTLVPCAGVGAAVDREV